MKYNEVLADNGIVIKIRTKLDLLTTKKRVVQHQESGSYPSQFLYKSHDKWRYQQAILVWKIR